MKGIILAGGAGTRLYPLTEGDSKQLQKVYDKTMIYYPLSTLMQAGIRDILIITTREDLPMYIRKLGDGRVFGINIQYTIQPEPNGLAQAFVLGRRFIGNDSCALVLGDNVFFGDDFREKLLSARENANEGYATIFGKKVHDPQRFGIMELGENGKVLSVEEKPEEPKSNYAITGLYFYDNSVVERVKDVKPSLRNEYEITDLNRFYLNDELLKYQLLGSGFSWYDTGTVDSLLDAECAIRSAQNTNGELIGCPEIIAYENGWITDEELEARGNLMSKNNYGQKILKKLKEGPRK